jgi:TfoX/Sxy family transcriptional regulator of competence genes
MPFDEHLADRIRQELNQRQVMFEEKKMMGGLCFMVNDKMCVGIVKDELMARIDPDIYETSLKREGARPMDFTGRSMKGFVFVGSNGLDLDQDLEAWIELALAYNPKAVSSRKKKKTNP